MQRHKTHEYCPSPAYRRAFAYERKPPSSRPEASVAEGPVHFTSAGMNRSLDYALLEAHLNVPARDDGKVARMRMPCRLPEGHLHQSWRHRTVVDFYMTSAGWNTDVRASDFCRSPISMGTEHHAETAGMNHAHM
jgi:hypothetical protein